MNNPPKASSDIPECIWQNDACLMRAGQLIDQSNGRIRAVSFDFFDTIVWRLVNRPTEVFFEVGRRLHAEKLLRPEISVADFEVLRRVGEMKTRERHPFKEKVCEDVTLAQIYEQLRTVVSDPVAAAGIEAATECELCFLNPVMVQFAQHAKSQGLKTLVISDIYLSADHLRAILRANHCDPGLFEFIFTSSDINVCKGTGNLFRHALEKLKLKPGELLHIGDNFHADVRGARKAGVLGCHYVQATHDTFTLLDRERFLLGGAQPEFNPVWLRMLAARNFQGDSDTAFFGRSGALLLGPLLTRFASWACEQFVAAGVRKVGAFMREGELLGEMLQREAKAAGHNLEIAPLYVNRKSTDLAAIGRLSADNLIDWLERRQTLSVGTILKHFGLDSAVCKRAPLALEDKPDKPDKILKLAKFLFTPEIAQRIEARSAEERKKVIDYLKPWLEGGAAFGVCDIGYNASAQMQLRHILELEGVTTKMVGCYLVTCERAASRVLDGLDIRHFLGAYGNPSFNNQAFLRSPAFVEQALTAECGTTLGYERQADGSVKPVLDEMRFSPELLRRQRSFKTGVLWYQQLWLWFRTQKPSLLAGSTDLSRRILNSIDAACAPILARATAFPLQSELAHFGSLPLDDYYFAEGVKTICTEKERELLRAKGYHKLLTEQGVLWPAGVLHTENPKRGSEFFALGKVLLSCDMNGDNEHASTDITVILSAGRNPSALRECLNHLKNVSTTNLRYEVFLLVANENKEITAVAQEFSRFVPRFRIFDRADKQSPIEAINTAVDQSNAPFLMFLDEGTLLPNGWDAAMLPAIRQSKDVGMVQPRIVRQRTVEDPLAATLRGVVVRRSAFIECLGLNDELGPVGAMWQLAQQLGELNWKTEFASKAAVEVKFAETAISLVSYEKALLKKRFTAFSEFAEKLSAQVTLETATVSAQPANSAPAKVDWIGSFLDAGSLSHVNRELTGALKGKMALSRINVGAETSPAFKSLAGELSKTATADATVTVRHAWPPDWSRPKSGKLAIVQPWEFGSLPEQWVKDLARVDEAWVPSEYVRRVYVDSGVPAEKVFVVPNGVDTKKFHPQAAPMKLATNKKFKFLFVGGTIFRKGPDVLLKAYLETFTAADDVCLVIKDFGGKTVYAGQTFEAKIRAAQALPNAPEILYLNEELAPHALPGLYTACDCLVLPYRGEGYGLPVVEAMACGLPVMVTAGGATDDFVRDEFGVRIPSRKQFFGNEISGLKLVKPGWLLEPDGAVLAERMKWMANHPDEARRRGQLASEHAKQFCSWEKAAEIALKRVEELASGRAQTKQNVVRSHGRDARATIVLPPCALVGHIAEAREFLRQKKSRAAWESALAAIAKRPFHPEAYLLLAEIALAVGNGEDAKLCADYARRIAPELKSVRKFLNQRLKGNTRPEWLKLPQAVHSPSAFAKATADGQSTVYSRLSVCLIVKNEEQFIGQCLKSIQGLAQQIVVVDTGSTDRTVEIAKELGAEVHSFAWCDDFSAARNAALEHVTGDWVLALDADEELKDHDKLRQAMTDAATMAWRLPIVDVGRELDGCSYVPRLFRNAPGLFYLGRVHEQIFSSIEVRRAEWGLENKIGEAVLIHHGYTQEVVRDRNKVERNLQLLQKAVEELPGEPHLLMNLGLELSRSGRETEAFARYREAFETLSAKPAAEIVPELRESLLTQYCTRLTATKQVEETVRVLTSPLARMSTGLTASLHFSLGLAHLELKQFSEAADQMRQCLAKRGQRSLSPINRDILTAAPHHCLAVCLAKVGQAAEAEKAFEAGLKEIEHVDGLRLDYAKFLFEQKRAVDALHRLNDIVSHDNRNVAAWRLGGQIALSQAEFLEFARDWTGEAMRHVPEDAMIISQRAETLMLSEDAANAQALWEKLWNSERNPQVLAALVLCEAVAGPVTHKPDDNKEEIAASRAFIEWYRKLFALRAQKTLTQVMGQIGAIDSALPSAAKMLAAAMAQANKETVGA